MPEYEEFMAITCDLLDLDHPDEVDDDFGRFVGQMNLLVQNAGGSIRSRQVVAMCLVMYEEQFGRDHYQKTNDPNIKNFLELIRDKIQELANEKAEMAKGFY